MPGIVDAHHQACAWPVCRLAAAYAEVIAAASELTAGVGPAERHDVFTGTAVRTCGLPVTARQAPPQETPCAWLRRTAARPS
ncbi:MULTISPECIES: hypothetical protein [unclassified Streptomyces]|uniref:hypothetical protein n=1 Tax=unclassified Streptomyces TaxID=2593676 RepID=UPI0038673687